MRSSSIVTTKDAKRKETTMLKLRELYKHTNNSDVAIYPLAYVGKNKLKVQWVNIVNPRHIFAAGDPDIIEIKPKDLPNWKPFDPKDIY